MAHSMRREGAQSWLGGLVGGRYRMTGLIARGGMGEVYAAHDEVLDRRVALKLLHSSYGADSEFVERFRREALSAAALSHPNIVTVFDWGRSEDGSAFMAMELVDGRNLRQVLTKHGPLPPQEAARIARQVCLALDVAGRAGIVHRDIKPENILVSPDGNVKVADFGVARALAESRATQAGTVLGTASYLAPEQVEGKPGDHRSDIYSLGIVLYEMLAGEAPFRGDNPVVVAYRRVAEDVPPVRDIAPGVPEELDAIIAGATARDPDDRYQSAATMGIALRPIAGEPDTPVIDLPGPNHTTAIPLAGQQTTVLRRRKPPKKRRGRKLVLALILLLVAGMVPVGVRLLSRVKVPDVDRLTQEAAQGQLEHAGFRVGSAILRNDSVVPQGSVISTSPVPGTTIRRGSTVRLIVSLGPLLVSIPDVRNKPLSEATKILNGKKLKWSVIMQPDDTIPKNTVIQQKPDASVSVPAYAVITLNVSSGPEQITMPNEAGKAERDAADDLRALGFKVAVAHLASNAAAGTVINTVPVAGLKANHGSTVTLNISIGPAEFSCPDVRGSRYDDAVAELKAKGLQANRKQVPGSYGDTVVSQIPKPGKKVHRGDTIILYTA